MDIRYLPKQEERVETGTIQFGDDWPGVFIRGDSCMHYAQVIGLLIEQYGIISPMICTVMKDLSELLNPNASNTNLEDGINESEK